MRVLLSTYGSRGDVEPMVGLAVRLRALGAEVRVCAPPDFAELLAGVGVPLVPVGRPVRPMVTGATPPPSADLPRRAVEWVAAQFDKVVEAAEGCDALVAGGMMPVAERSVTEQLGIRYVYASYQPITLPSPHRPPLPRPGRPFPPEVTDNRALWDLDAQDIKELFGAALNTHRASMDLPPVDNVRDHIYTDHPWLATDPTLSPWQPTDLDVVQTGAWIVPDERPLPAELEAFLDAGTPPVYVGFGSMPMRASKDAARVAIEAIRAAGPPRTRLPRLGRPGPDRRPGRLLRRRRGQPAGTVRPGGRRRAPRRRGHDDDGRPGQRTSGGGTPGGGPAILGRPGGRPGHRHGTRRSDSDHRVPVSRAQDDPDPREPRTSDRRARTIRTDGATVAATLLLDAVSRERPPASAMTTTIALTDTERAYLQSRPLGRLATVDAGGAPQNNPIGVFLDEETGDIVVGGHAMGATRKFRNVQANAQVALVIDDLVSTDPWTVRGLEIRGTAVALSDVDPPVSFMSREVIRITPRWVCAWGLDPDVQGRQVRSKAAKASGATVPHTFARPPRAGPDR